jgi:ribosomal protein S18 acetylase RimI-like enzyme
MNYNFKNITIRTDLRPGDLGYVIYLHGYMYGQEYQYGISFETYVAKGMYEFYAQYDDAKDRVWICEDEGRIIGFLLGMHRGEEVVQLRFFILLPGYRGMGLGKKLMEFFMEYLREKKFRSCYLWTTNQQATAAFIYKRLGFVLTEEKPSDAFGVELMEQRYDLQLV